MNKIKSLKWVALVSRRFSRVDRKGRSAATSFLAMAGIAFGVMTLIVVMSIMNGFQMHFIDSILELSSYHLRISDLSEENEEKLKAFCDSDSKIRSCTYFYESQALMTGQNGGESAVLLRAINPLLQTEDAGFLSELKIISGRYDLMNENSILLGSSLARNLGVRVGSTVNLLVMSGGSDVELFSQDRIFTVTGIFSSGYAEINSSYAFVNDEFALKYFGIGSQKIWGIKLHRQNDDLHYLSVLKKNFPNANVSSWRDYNKTFFGALRVEKNMLLLLVALIFVVVAVNIYNGMRRLVFERKSEIATLSALGGGNLEIKLIFILRGAFTGLAGSLIGLLLGLLISFNTDVVFAAAAKIMYFIQYIFTAITNPKNLMFVQENSSYSLYAEIPARIFPSEVAAITIFGFLAPLIASYLASKNVLKMNVSEVLHNE